MFIFIRTNIIKKAVLFIKTRTKQENMTKYGTHNYPRPW